MLIHKKGDLLDLAEAGEFDAIVHGCNCFNTMGSGIARQIADRYPGVRDIDGVTAKGSIKKLGDWTAGPIETENGYFRIFNAYTQYGTSADGRDVFEYESFYLILRKLAHVFGDEQWRWGFPYIGMGLAGGDKTRIMAMLENFAKEILAKGGTVTLVEFG